MNLSEPNITLKNISEVKDGGLKISLLKLLNEAFNKDKSDVRLKRTSNKINSNYSKLLSVIICTLNIGASFLKAAESVLDQEFPADKYEIIVVNNSDTPIDTDKLPHKIKVVNEPSKGLSKARNVGAARAAGEYLLYIDDDAVANENLLFNMFNAFEDHKNYAIIGGQIFLRLPEPTPAVFLKGKEALWSGYTVPYKKFKEVCEQYEFPYGACFGIRHSVLDSFGGFPDDYGRCGRDYAGGEETALCFMAKNSRLKIGIEPNASVCHNVAAERFTKKHIQMTIRAGILTTYRLYLDGYSKNGWTKSYIDERIKIISAELKNIGQDSSSLLYFYKKCELDSFCELRNSIN